MILISAALVLAAIVLLIAGVVLAKPFLVMWSIVISVLSAVCLLIGALLRRHELFPAGGRAAVGPVNTPQGPSVPPQFTNTVAHTGAMPVGAMLGGTPGQLPHHGAVAIPPSAPVPATATMPVAASVTRPPVPAVRGLGSDMIVLVIPGRRRFHLPDCRQLVGREVEELTVEEAREEGFTPCTTCRPEGRWGSEAAETAESPMAGPIPETAEHPERAKTPDGRDARDDHKTSQRVESSADETAETAPAAETPESAALTADPGSKDGPRPGGSQRPGGYGRPGDAARPGGAAKSGDAAKSGGANRPGGAAKSGDAAKPGRAGGGAAAAGAESTAGSDPDEADPADTAEFPAVVTKPAGSVGRSSAASETTPAKTSAKTPAASAPKPSAATGPIDWFKRPGPASAGAAAPEPVEPAETAEAGRAGLPAPAGSTSTSPSASTASALAPGVTVRVMAGTRRYHRAGCPLLRAADKADIETMPGQEAESAGLTPCSVCAAKPS
ncbi:hypothetical protein ACQP1K_18730 [Sphaerimonospora sp. CA-214678]|uniref:hypothetical protein n=1 Tax=Sphaerimonospora sp. CA-214678 TaxID=3240029 RepID=UPI003D8FAEA8